MARPPKDPNDKAIKQSISIKPDLLPHLLHYCQVEERTMSWVIEMPRGQLHLGINLFAQS